MMIDRGSEELDNGGAMLSLDQWMEHIMIFGGQR
jgi:hypothetical protein